MIWVVLDTNIFVSALEFGGTPLRLLEKARAGEFEVAISTPIIDEIKRVLREKFGWPESRLEQFERNVSQFTHRVEPTIKLDIVKDDPSDDKFAECAVEAGAEAIITGDKDLLRVVRCCSLTTMNPSKSEKLPPATPDSAQCSFLHSFRTE